MRSYHAGRWGVISAVVISAAWAFATQARAFNFEWDEFGGITGVLNTSISLAAQVRLQSRRDDLVGKTNLNRNVCRSTCQPHLSTAPGDVPGRVQLGLEAEGSFVNDVGVNAPGIASLNTDEGNLNFDKWDITQLPVVLDQDLTLEFGDRFGIRDVLFFARINAFHDFENYQRNQYYENFYTPEDRARDDARQASGTYGFPTPGSRVFRENGDGYDDLLGQAFNVLDIFIQGRLPSFGLLENDIQFTIGEQNINWGESTILSVNSLNTINPPNVNALFRPAFLSLATVFEPVGAVKLSAPLTLNTSMEVFWQYDWEKVEIPPRGGFLSFIDITLGADDNIANPGFGQAPDDPDGNLKAQQQLLTAVADVEGRVPIDERNAPSSGQYGVAFTWFAPRFNNGTEFRFYFTNYHSRLPYLSAFGGDESCYQQSPSGDIVTDTVNLIQDCPNLDFSQFLGSVAESVGGQAAGQLNVLGTALNAANLDLVLGTGGNGIPCPPDAPPGSGPCAEAYRLDSFRGLLEYPEDIKLYGISFNTSFGAISVQGEIAYRPNLPLQIDDVDVAFAALQPSAPVGCANGAVTQNRSADCRLASFSDRYEIGVPGVTGLVETIANSGDAVAAVGQLLGVDLSVAGDLVDSIVAGLAASGLDLQGIAAGLQNSGIPSNVILSDPPGRRNAFPDFLSAYRGVEPGTYAPGEYIQGFERFQVFQYNLGATYVIGPGNWVRSNQIILLFELGATHVLDFPDRDELQIEGPGTYNHASVGTDGSGAQACPAGVVQGDSGRSDLGQANSTLCGPFQLRFNPTQERGLFADEFSAGYRIIGIVRYENVFPGISFEPLFVIWHDFYNTAPGPGENFVEGRQIYILNVEMRVGQNWSGIAGVTIFRGAGKANVFNDRDFLQFGIRYRF